MTDRYGSDIFSHDPNAARRVRSRPHPTRLGDVVEDIETGWVGAVLRVEKSGGIFVVELEDRRGQCRTFPLGPGFLLDGKPVILMPPKGGANPSESRANSDLTDDPASRSAPGSRGYSPTGLRTPPRLPARTASGSRATGPIRAKVALPSRIWVEGRHDADLVMKVWGEDLGYDGVAVELLAGVDNLAEMLREFRPSSGRRVGVLVDHFVPGSKETRLVSQALAGLPGAEHVLVLGHPYIDVWQAVKPERVGLRKWPQIPRSVDIKLGTLQALGLPHANQADIARGWQAILARVRNYADLEPSLIGRMEELIDFVLSDRYGH